MIRLEGRISEKRKRRKRRRIKRAERDEDRKRKKRGVSVSALYLGAYVRAYLAYIGVCGGRVLPHTGPSMAHQHCDTRWSREVSK